MQFEVWHIASHPIQDLALLLLLESDEEADDSLCMEVNLMTSPSLMCLSLSRFLHSILVIIPWIRVMDHWLILGAVRPLGSADETKQSTIRIDKDFTGNSILSFFTLRRNHVWITFLLIAAD
jgi:hypothetical protein